MPIVRTEYNFRRSSEVANSAIDITSYDLVGRFTENARVGLCGASETPMFVFAESAEAFGDPVSVIWLAKGGRMALRLSGTGNKGQKLVSNASGRIIASGTAETAAPAAGDFAIALEDWGDQDVTEVEILA